MEINDNRVTGPQYIYYYQPLRFENLETTDVVKFIYSEKASKFWQIFPLILTTVHTVKSEGKISQNCVVFSEYMNFKHKSTLHLRFHWTSYFLIIQGILEKKKGF